MFHAPLAHALLCATVLCACSGGGANPLATPVSAVPAALPAPPAPPAPPAAVVARGGLNGQLVMGYQGWFGCPGDFDGNLLWQHWFVGAPRADHFVVDMLPATAALAAADLCPTGILQADGAPLYLFSSQNSNVVLYHFQLMAHQSVGAVAVQRFVVEIADPARKRRADNVLANIVNAAQVTGVPFYITYDVSGANPATVSQAIRDDWQYLDAGLSLTASANYLHDSGKPLLELWGFGFTQHPGTPQEVAALIADLKAGRRGLKAVTLIGGVPANWRTLQGDAQTDPAWGPVYLGYDVLSPWTVGRYVDEPGAQAFYSASTAPDLIAAQANGTRVLPVIFPGFSWYNLMTSLGQPQNAIVNQIPRNCGNFFWFQSHLLLSNGVDMAYGAMFDELDESTAMLPALPLSAEFPSATRGVYLDMDGCTLPANWYVNVMGQVADNFHTQTVPTNALALPAQG